MSDYPDAAEIYDGDGVSAVKSCGCYECVGSDLRWDGHGQYVHNNFKHHTLGEACENCGRPKGKYRDLGRKGYYVCYVCE